MMAASHSCSAEPEAMLGYNELALKLRITPRTIQKWMARGDFPKPDLRTARLCRWHNKTVEDWISQKQDSSSPNGQ